MSNGYLVERLNDVTPIPTPVPSNMIKIPTDDSYINNDPIVQETITTNTIRSVSDYVTVVNPIVNLHSKMRNEFYSSLMNALASESQFLIDYSSYLKTLFDIDYFDGDSISFNKKIFNLVSLFDYKGPVFFSTSVNFENGNSRDITKEQDYLRNLVKHIWLGRAWAGTGKGYALPFKLVNRLGSAHPRSIYSESSNILDISTGKMYRLLDNSYFQLAIPNGANTQFPNSPHIPATKSLNYVTYPSLYWDTGHTWDESPTISWDELITPPNYGKGLMLEYSLDRILHNTNALGTLESLQQSIFITAIEAQLLDIQKASESVSVGSQLTLVTSKDGRFNTLSQVSYTHPNIKAKFQVMAYLSDKITPAWSSISSVNTIKIGSGGYNITNVDNNIFVDKSQNPNDPSKIIPLDLQSPLYESYIGTAEKEILSVGFGLINTSIHPRNFNNIGGTANILINGINSLSSDIHPTSIQLSHTLISKGTLNYGIYISKPRRFSLTITSVTGASYGTIIIAGITISLTTDNVSSIPKLISTLSSQTYLGWSVTTSNTTLNFISSDPNSDLIPLTVVLGTATNIGFSVIIIDNGVNSRSVFQKILLIENINKETNGIIPYSKIQKMLLNGNYHDIENSTTLYGYSSDSSYSLPTDGYMPVATDQAVEMLPIYSMDKHPTLFSGLVLNYNFDDTPEIPNLCYISWSISGSWSPGAYFSLNGIQYQATGSTAIALSAQIATIIQSGYSFTNLTGSFKITKISNPSLNYNYPTATSSSGIIFTLINNNIQYINNIWTTTDNWTCFDGTVNVNNGKLISVIQPYIGTNPYLTRLGTSLSNGNNFLFKLKSDQNLILNFGVYVNGVYQSILTFNSSSTDTIYRALLPLSGTLTNPTITLITAITIQTTITISWIYSGSSEYTLNSIHDCSGLGSNNIFNDIINYGSINKKAVAYSNNNGIIVSPNSNINNLTTLSISLLFDSSSNSTGTLISKHTSGSGWRLRYLNTNLLEFTSEKTTQAGTWTCPCLAQSKNFIILTYDNVNNPIIRLNGITQVMTQTSTPSGTLISDSGNSLGIGIDSDLTNGFIGSYEEIRLYNRVLSYDEKIQLESDYLNRLIPVLDYQSNPTYYYFDSVRGMICMKLQYDSNGLLQNAPEATAQYTQYTATLSQTYSLNISTGIVSISEMGLFDLNHNLLAYATFPPVIYDASKNHISFNLLIGT
jgi:hypothetical protein